MPVRVPTDIKARRAITIDGHSYIADARITVVDLEFLARTNALSALLSKGVLYPVYAVPRAHDKFAGHPGVVQLPVGITQAILAAEETQDAPALPTAGVATAVTLTSVSVAFMPRAPLARVRLPTTSTRSARPPGRPWTQSTPRARSQSRWPPALPARCCGSARSAPTARARSPMRSPTPRLSRPLPRPWWPQTARCRRRSPSPPVRPVAARSPRTSSPSTAGPGRLARRAPRPLRLSSRA